jgi:hypothetical protein
VGERALLYCKIFGWVHREGREEKRKKEREICKLSEDRTVCFHIIYYKAQFYGRIPREKVNHVYLVVVCN